MDIGEIFKNGASSTRKGGQLESQVSNEPSVPFTLNRPVYRIYLTSSQCFTAIYKQIVVHQLLQATPPLFPIIDSFGGDALNLSTVDLQQKIKSADAMIAIVSPYYGKEIRQVCDACPVNSICKDKAANCSLSYLHYQLLLAKIYNLRVYIIAHHTFNDTTQAISTFADNQRECQQECKNLYALQITNRNCSNDCSANIENVLTKAKQTGDLFELIREQHYPISYFSDISSLKAAISNVMSVIEGNLKDTSSGIISYESIINHLQKAQLYEEVSLKGISNIFNNQDEALKRIETLYQENKLYGDNKQVRVLCFRGLSFITDHEWSKFIFSKYTKKASQIEIEFLLADLDNKDVILRRWEAFSKDEEDYESFRKKYSTAMKRVKEILLNDEDEYECKLYIHNVAELPFRMVFLGEYLYLSFFLNAVKATDSPVYEVRQGSALYSACLEYYNRIKKNSKLVTK